MFTNTKDKHKKERQLLLPLWSWPAIFHVNFNFISYYVDLNSLHFRRDYRKCCVKKWRSNLLNFLLLFFTSIFLARLFRRKSWATEMARSSLSSSSSCLIFLRNLLFMTRCGAMDIIPQAISFSYIKWISFEYSLNLFILARLWNKFSQLDKSPSSPNIWEILVASLGSVRSHDPSVERRTHYPLGQSLLNWMCTRCFQLTTLNSYANNYCRLLLSLWSWEYYLLRILCQDLVFN